MCLFLCLCLCLPLCLLPAQAFAEDDGSAPPARAKVVAEVDTQAIPQGITGPATNAQYQEPFKVDPSYINAVEGGFFARIGLFNIRQEEPAVKEEIADYLDAPFSVVLREEVRAAERPFYLFSNASSAGENDLYLIVAPNLNWEDISREGTPELFEFVWANASANVINNVGFVWEWVLDNERFHYLVIPSGAATDVERVSADTVSHLGSNNSVIITSSPCFVGAQSNEESYSVFVMRNTSDRGLVTSGTTHHRGLITSEDAMYALCELLKSPQRHPYNLDISAFSNSFTTDQRLSMLIHDATVAQATQASQGIFVVIFVVCIAIAIGCSLVMLFLEASIKPRLLARLLPLSRVLWIVTLALPVASFVMFVHLPSVADAQVVLDYCAFYALAIAFVCIVIALVAHWTWAYVFMLSFTVFVLVTDQLLGGPLSAGGYLSYAPIEHVRYYGMGNEGAALLFGAWTSLVGLFITKRRSSRISEMLISWLYPVASLAILLVIAAPWWGANFGSLIWGTVGIFVTWLLLKGRSVRKRDVLVAVGLAGAFAFCVLLADTALNSESHMGSQFDMSNPDWIGQIVTIFTNVAKMSFDTLVFAPPLTVLFVLLMVSLYVVYFKQPGLYREFWQKHPAFLASSKGLMVSAVLMLIFEDSGILMPALLLLYPISGLVWVLCDYHSWHIRDFINFHNEKVMQREAANYADEAGEVPAEEGN